MPEIYIDKPITEISEDCLGRANFAQGLANALCNDSIKDGYTVGLYGSWGCGKTSLLNIIERYIIQKQNVKVIHFNPWLCDNANQMALQFFSLLINEFTDNTRKALTDFATTFLDCIRINTAVSVNTEKIAEMLSVERKPLLVQKNEITKILKGSVKLIIMIDDIDRLHKDEVSEIFRLVKSIADFPNVVYLLSFDREKVVKLLNSANNSDDGDSYLEKIIQYPIEVPQPSDNAVWDYFCVHLQNCFNTHTTIFGDDDKNRLRELLDNGLRNLIINMRDSKRYLNTFLFNISSIGTETNIVDLMGITALQVFAPNVYKRIQLSKVEIFPDPFLNAFSNQNDNDRKNSAKRLIDYLIGREDEGNLNNKEKGGKGIINTLFTHILDYYNRDNDNINSCRISIKNCFDRYFTLQLDKESISNEELNAIFSSNDMGETIGCVLRIESSNRLELLLRHIHCKFINAQDIDLDVERRCNIFLAIMVAWENSSHKYPDYADLFVGLDFDKVMNNLNSLLESLPEKNRVELLVDSIENLKFINSVRIFDRIERLMGRINNSERSSKILSDEGIQTIENCIFSRIEKLIDESKLWIELYLAEDIYILRLIYVLEAINAELCIKVKSYVKSEIEKSDSYLLHWIGHQCVSKGTVSSSSSSWYCYIVNISETYISFDEAYNRLLEYAQTLDFIVEPINFKLKFAALYLYQNSDKENNKRFECKENEVIRVLKEIEKKTSEKLETTNNHLTQNEISAVTP